MKDDVLKDLEKVGIEKAIHILLAYAKAALNRKYWRSGRSTGPGGKEPQDFVFEAITKALTVWNWNKTNKPEVIDYLKSRIDGLISNQISGAENTNASDEDINSSEFPSIDSSPSVDDILERKLVEDKMDSIIKAAIGDAEDRIFDVFEAMKLGYQTIEIEELLNLDARVINNYKKRIRYQLNDFKK